MRRFALLAAAAALLIAAPLLLPRLLAPPPIEEAFGRDFAAALAESAATKRLLLVHLRKAGRAAGDELDAEWRRDGRLRDALADRFVNVRLDADRDADVVESIAGPGAAVATIALAEDGQPIGRLDGFASADEQLAFLDRLAAARAPIAALAARIAEGEAAGGEGKLAELSHLDAATARLELSAATMALGATARAEVEAEAAERGATVIAAATRDEALRGAATKLAAEARERRAALLQRRGQVEAAARLRSGGSR